MASPIKYNMLESGPLRKLENDLPGPSFTHHIGLQLANLLKDVGSWSLLLTLEKWVHDLNDPIILGNDTIFARVRRRLQVPEMGVDLHSTILGSPQF